MTQAAAPEARLVRYVRSTRRTASGQILQEWRSDTTGRAFEVRESASYAPASALRPGAKGYLAFVEGSAVVTRSADRPQERARLAGPEAAPPPRGTVASGSRWLWLLLVVLVGAVVLGLVRP